MSTTILDLQTWIGKLATTENQLQFKVAQTFINDPDKDEVVQLHSSTITIPLPFSSRIVQVRKSEVDDELLQTFSMVEINIPLLDAMKQIPKYVKFLKKLCTNKRKKLKGDMKMRRNVFSLIKKEQVSASIQFAMPKKCRDPNTFTIPCIIVYRSLRLGALEPTGVVIQLANRSTAHPLGILEDVLVQVSDIIFPKNFYVLDMKDELFSKGPILILGRPFLKVVRTKIDVHVGTFSMEMEYNIFEAMEHPIENHSVFYLDVIHQLGDDYINFHDEFHDFNDFTDCECTCTRLNKCPICLEINIAINACVGVVDITNVNITYVDIVGMDIEGVVEVAVVQPPFPSIVQPLKLPVFFVFCATYFVIISMEGQTLLSIQGSMIVVRLGLIDHNLIKVFMLNRM
ncbi:hypothetical protein CR513_31283, partial [Mucuna pruriens]